MRGQLTVVGLLELGLRGDVRHGVLASGKHGCGWLSVVLEVLLERREENVSEGPSRGTREHRAVYMLHGEDEGMKDKIRGGRTVKKKSSRPDQVGKVFTVSDIGAALGR